MNSLIIGTTGLPSSGKGLFCEVAVNYGFKILVMGDVIRQECVNRGLPVNRESSDKVMVDLRAERGVNAIALITLDWIDKALKDGHEKILIDGIRSLPEVNTFTSEFPEFLVVGLHADPNTRLKRALARRREDDAFSEDAFHKRDQIELNVGIGNVIAKSDILISTSEELDKTILKIENVLEILVSSENSIPVGVAK